MKPQSNHPYCFKAHVTLVGPTVRRFTAYGKSPSVCQKVLEACREYNAGGEPGLCTVPVLTMHHECPVEADEAVHIQVIRPENTYTALDAIDDMDDVGDTYIDFGDLDID